MTSGKDRRQESRGRSAAPTTTREKKREEFLAGSGRRRTPWIVGAALVVVAAMAAVAIVLTSGDKATTVAAETAPKASSTTAGGGQTAVAGETAITLPVAEITAKARFYSADMGGTQVAFFVAKTPDGTVRSAFDACQVCYAQKKGYRQEGDTVVCNNCGRSFPIDRVGLEQGGCNPVPLAGTLADGQLVFTADALAAGAPLFR